MVIPVLVIIFLITHSHYAEVAVELSLEGLERPPEFQHTVLVLVGDVHRGVVRARCSTPERWPRMTSPYRSLLAPLLEYLDHIQSRGENQMVTVVLPEFLPRRWWQHTLHNQTALLVKGALLYRKNTVVADVPYLLKR